MLIDNFSAGIVGGGDGHRRRLGHRAGRPTRITECGRQRRRLAGQPSPAAVRLGPHRARQGAVPQQRHQPRRARPAGRRRSRRSTASRSCSCSSPTPAPASACSLAYLLFGPRSLRPSAPAAIIIQFLGGIHEIYFPYVLMKPRLILAMIAGGAAGVLVLHDHRRRPGRHAVARQHLRLPGGHPQGRLLRGAARHRRSRPGSRFAVASALLGFGRLASDEPEAASAPDATRPGGPAPTAPTALPAPTSRDETAIQHRRPRRRDRHAHHQRQATSRRSSSPATRAWAAASCSPASSARQLHGQSVEVEHTPVNSIPADADVVVVPRGLADRARVSAPDTVIVPVPGVHRRPGGHQARRHDQERRRPPWLRPLRCRSTRGPSGWPSRAGTATTRSASAGEALRRRRRGRPGVRRRDARAGAVDLHVRRGGRRDPARHAGRQGRRPPRRARRRSASRTGVDWDGEPVTLCVGDRRARATAT